MSEDILGEHPSKISAAVSKVIGGAFRHKFGNRGREHVRVKIETVGEKQDA